MARKKTKNVAIEEKNNWIDMAIEDLRSAVKQDSATKQARVFEELESRIGRKDALKFWPAICKQATGEEDTHV